MFKRNISVDDVRVAVDSGEIIMSYIHDRPYPSYLMLGYINDKPLHVVVAKDDQLNRCIIVTTYTPDENIWNSDFKSKKD
jgi:hypothetical protein